MKKCKYCGKLTDNKTYCSRSCAGFMVGKISGKIGAKKSHEIQKQNKTGFWGISKEDRIKNGKIGGKLGAKVNRKNKTGFWDPKIQSMGGKVGGKKAVETNRRNKTGLYGISKEDRIKNGKISGKIGGKRVHELYTNLNKKIDKINKLNRKGFYGISKEDRIENAKKAAITNKRNKTGFWGMSKEDRIKNAIKSNKTNKKNKTGLWDPKIRAMGSKIGGLKSVEVNRKNKPYVFNNIHFDSNKEREFAMNINFQYKKLGEGVNCHIKVGSKTIDFLLEMFKCFIEFHPYDMNGLSYKEYIRQRREVLNANNYKNYGLIVIK